MLRTTHSPPIPHRFLQPVETAERDAARIAELLEQLRARPGRIHQDVLQELKDRRAVPALISAIDIKRRQRLAVKYGSLRLLGLALLLSWFFSTFLGKEVFWLLFVCFLPGSYPKPNDRPIVQALMAMRDVRSVGVLIRVLRWEFEETERKEIRACLALLLPRLTWADRHLLEVEDRRLLRQRLKAAARSRGFAHREGADFLIAAVKALVQIRDTDSLPALRRLASRARNKDVRHIAELGVTELEARVAGQGTTP